MLLFENPDNNAAVIANHPGSSLFVLHVEYSVKLKLSWESAVTRESRDTEGTRKGPAVLSLPWAYLKTGIRWRI